MSYIEEARCLKVNSQENKWERIVYRRGNVLLGFSAVIDLTLFYYLSRERSDNGLSRSAVARFQGPAFV